MRISDWSSDVCSSDLLSASRDEVQILRSPVDECFHYIVELLDEAIVNLPERIDFEIVELGRITKTIALSVKAKLLVPARSEERRVGTEWVSTCRSRWTTYHT